MCSLFVTNASVSNLDGVNRLTQRRGPDATTVTRDKEWTMVHNLLSITGTFTKQPHTNGRGVHVLFNGEIYNWREFDPTAASDSLILLPLYEQYGTSFVSKLDGEFAVVVLDPERATLSLAVDAFATKPLWIGRRGAEVAVATYESVLIALGFEEREKVPANTRIEIDTRTGIERVREPVVTFDPAHQHKADVNDFLAAFSASIRKRASGVRESIFIGLSSGYDSGAIASELLEQKIPFHAYSIYGQEDRDVLGARHLLLPPGSGTLLDYGYREYRDQKRELRSICEPFMSTLHPRYPNKNILDDAGAVGLGLICKQARREGYKIYLSGQGADEILSDYRMHGHGLTGHSTLQGKFPNDLTKEFPWHNFYDGAQKFYIAKEEHVAGAYGIEARYPYLDKALVQEFLWLAPSVKNAAYKYPLQVLFEKRRYPYMQDVKVGFIPRRKTFSEYIARAVDMLLRQQ